MIPVFALLDTLLQPGVPTPIQRLMESDVVPSYADRPFDPREAATNPFGVGSVTPQDVQNAMYDTIQSRLDDCPSEGST